MRVKTAGLLLLTLLTGALAFGEDLSAPAGRYIRQGQSIDLLGDVDTTGKADGDCLGYNSTSGDWEPTPCGSGGGSGSSVLQVALGGTQVSSPTATINLSSSVFSASASPSTTANVSLNASSVTLQSNTFNIANKLLQLDSSGLIPNSLVDPSSVTKLGNSITLGSETTGNYVASLVAGQGISVGAAGAGATPTVEVNPATLVGDQTWSNGSVTPVRWLWDVTGVDPGVEFGDDLFTFLSPITVPTITALDGNFGDLNVDNLTASEATVGGKNVAQYSETLITGSTVNYASGTIHALYVDTINGASYPPAGSGGGGFWIGTATSALNMQNLYSVHSATMVATSSFTLTAATETINGITYVRAPLASMGTGQKLLVYTVSGGRMIETISDVILDGMQRSSTDTVTAAKIFQSSVTIPVSTGAAGTPDATGELSLKTTAISSTMGTIQVYDGTQLVYVVVTTNTPSDNYIPKYDAASGKVRWEEDAGTGGSGTPGGSHGYFQINDASTFAGVAEMQYSTTTKTITWSSATVHTNVSSDTYTNVNIVLAGTSAIYSGSDAGDAGDVLTSNGPGVPPTWNAAGGSMNPYATYYAQVSGPSQQSGYINIASGTVANLNTTTLKFANGTTKTTAAPAAGEVTGPMLSFSVAPDVGLPLIYNGDNFLTDYIGGSQISNQQLTVDHLNRDVGNFDPYEVIYSSANGTFYTGTVSSGSGMTPGVTYYAQIDPVSQQTGAINVASGTLATMNTNSIVGYTNAGSSITLGSSGNMKFSTIGHPDFMELTTSGDILAGAATALFGGTQLRGGASVGGAAVFFEAAANGDNYVMFRAKSSLGVNTVFDMDLSSGTAGYLYSVGDGTMVLNTPAGGGSKPPREYWWPAVATLALEAGDSIATIGKSTGTNVDQLVVDFDQGTDECRTVNFKIPTDPNTSGTATFYVHWKATTTSTNNVIWDIRHNGGVGEGASPDAALTTVAASADAAQGTAGQITITSWTLSMATAGWTAGEEVDAQFCRDANAAGDTLGADARAVGFGVDIPRS